MATDGTQARPWWTVPLGVGVVLVVILAVSGALGRADLPDRADDVQRGGDSACEPDDCEVWRADLGGGRVRTTARFAVHEAGGTLTVIDLADGGVAWQRQRIAGPPAELYVDDDVIVVTDPDDDGPGVRLMVFETATGRPGLDHTYDEFTTVSDLHRVRDELSLTVTPATGDAASRRSMVSLADGEVRGLVSGPHTGIRWRNSLVVWAADEVIGVTDAGDATVDWRADGSLTDVDLTGGRVLLRAPSGEYEVRALSSGARLWATSGEGLSQVQFIGSWVGLTSEAGMEVVDPGDGSVRFERRGVAPTARVAHLALERYTVVAWPVEEGVEIVAYDSDGMEVFSRPLRGADAAAAWTTFAPVAGRPDMVQVVGDAGRRSTWLALPTGEVVRAAADEDPRPWDRDFADGLLWRSRPGELVIEGPAGSLAIEGAAEVISVDPLVVHGPDALARLDPAAVFGPSTG